MFLSRGKKLDSKGTEVTDKRESCRVEEEW